MATTPKSPRAAKKAASQAADAAAGAATPRPFPVTPNSPFGDGYDLEGERAALKDLSEEEDFDKVTLDPRYQRYLELERREALLKQMQNAHRHRDGAEPEVPQEEANKVNFTLGRLTDEEEDSMALHTRESARLFMGRTIEPGRQGYGQSGAKKVGAALRAIWYLSGNDNPYADFCLIEASSRIAERVRELEQLITENENRLSQLKRRGLNFSVLRADPPVTVNLGFKSPYGYSVVNLVSTFDFYVRVVKTLARKDLLSDKEGYSLIFTQTKACRSIFERVIWFQRYLMKEELRALSRADWLPSADDTARKRVQAAVTLFGELPREVFNGALMPRHSRRRLDLSEQELRLLDEVPLAGAEPQLAAAEAALV
ncbi:MAG: TIGR03761 family integrating conjugative element protein [Rubrivivax sp.]|nr:TIGR03761 family integrating conjugative element protein [Rubrivivax sp.]